MDIQVEHDRAAIIGWYRGARSRWFGKASAALGSEDCDIEEQVNDGVVIWFRYACVERPQDFWAAMDSDRGEVAFSHLGQWKFWGSFVWQCFLFCCVVAVGQLVYRSSKTNKVLV